MSLKSKAKERIKRYQSRSPIHQRMRDRMATPLSMSGAIKLIREAMDRTHDEKVLAEMRRRLDHLERVEGSEALQAEEKERCRTDVSYWFDTYAWTYDPRIPQPFVPLVMWDQQRAFIHWFEDREKGREDGIVEKSRDAGATWLTAMYLLHHWLFVPGFKGAVGSRKEDLVDKTGDPDSIFEKLRLALRMVPEWMLPRGLKPKLHYAYLKLINPENGATITGEAGDNIGRGGRASIYVIDEAAFIARPQKVEAALSLTSDVKIYVSTPNGIGNVFYKKRFSGAFSVFTFRWKDDPRKNRWVLRNPDGTVFAEGHGAAVPDYPDGSILEYPWYESMRRKYEHDPVVLAQEVDIDYSASQEGITIPAAWVRAAVELRLPKRGPIRGALDVADEGGSKNVLTVRQGPFVLAVYHWTKGNTTRTAWKAINLLEQHGATEFAYDAAGGYGSGIKGATQSADRPIRVNVKGVNVGNPPTTDRWDDGKQAKDKFSNLKAELWWKLRRRFEKAYEFVEMGIQHPTDEMISIPNHAELIAQLSVVQHFETESGKVRIESKKELKSRGVSSPDFAESLMLTEAKVSTFDVVAGGDGAPQSASPVGSVNFHGSGVAVTNQSGPRDRRVD